MRYRAFIAIAITLAAPAVATSHVRTRAFERHVAVRTFYACAHQQPAGAQLIAIRGISNRVKCALAWQANGGLRRHWRTPPIAFADYGTPGAWPIYTSMANAPDPSQWGEHIYHAMYVHNTTDTETISHELIEELADPDGSGLEIADPVNGNQWAHAGVALSNFVFPSFFVAEARGPYDEIGIVHRPLDYTYGFAFGADPR